MTRATGLFLSLTWCLYPKGFLSREQVGAYEAVEWRMVSDLPKLGYDHNEIVATALERLRSRITYTNIVYGLLPKEFTLGELQKIYEIILGEKLDKRNFRKKYCKQNCLKNLQENSSAKLIARLNSTLFQKKPTVRGDCLKRRITQELQQNQVMAQAS